MVAIGLLFVLLVICVFVGSIGFLIGYFVGRRSGARDRQVGFPVLPTAAEPDGIPEKNSEC
jgi:hypothetical protein